MKPTSRLESIDSAFEEVFVDPRRETPMATVNLDHYSLKYLYSRSSESQRINSTGQDALGIRFNEERIVFAICDGVGQSYNGQIAAQIVCKHLVQWLWEQPAERVLDKRGLAYNAGNFLEDLTLDAKEIVKKYPIPSNSAPIVKKVLEEMKATGSETTFVCGCIFMPTCNHIYGGASVLWLGDTLCKITDKNGKSIDLGSAFMSGQHWSTEKGLSGIKPNVWTQRGLSGIDRLIVYSDGLIPISDIIEQDLDGELISGSATYISNGGTGDDLSFIEVNIRNQPIVVTKEIIEQPIISYVKVASEEILVQWLRTNELSRYKIRYELDNSVIEKVVDETELKIPVKKWNNIKLNIQRIKSGQASMITTVEFYNRNHDRTKLYIAVLVTVIATIIGYLIGRGQ